MRLVKTIIQIAVSALFFFTAFLLVTSKTNKLAGLQSFVVLTGSMQPKLPIGSVIFTQKKEYYQKGDIISFRLGNVTVTHRVVEKTNENSFITKGDANQSRDKTPVLQQYVLGREVFALPYIGRFIIFLKTGLGFLIFVIFPALLFIISEIHTIKKEFEKELEKKLVNRIVI